MRASCVGGVLVLWAVAWAGAAAAQPRLESQPGDEKGRAAREIEALIREMADVSGAGDPGLLDKYYAPDVIIVDRAGVTRGWARYKQTRPAQQMKTEQVDRTRSQGGHGVGDVLVKVKGSVAWATYTYTLTLQAQGVPKEYWGVGTAVLERRSGRWQIVQAQTVGSPRENWEKAMAATAAARAN